MPKPLLGLLLGTLLGAIDGACAYLYPYPEVREQIAMIVMFSSIKGLLTGMTAGFVAHKWQSLPLGIGVGFVVGAALSVLATMNPDPNARPIFWEIVLPGMALGVIVGFATQKYGRAPQARGAA